MTSDEFNHRYRVGTPVRYWTSDTTGPGIESQTQTPAWTTGDHTPVVSVDGHSEGIALTHIRIEARR